MKEAKNLLINRRVWGLEEAAEVLEYLWWLASRWKYLPQKLGQRRTAKIGTEAENSREDSNLFLISQ